MQDLAKFGKICKLKSFIPFRSAQDALDNINAVSEVRKLGLRSISTPRRRL